MVGSGVINPLPAGEPVDLAWRSTTITELVYRLAAGAPAGRPRIVAVDGRSGAGKTNLAARLHAATPFSAIVRVDDIAWHGSFFAWTDTLTTGVLEPLHHGRGVAFRPPAWIVHGRPDAITVPAGLDLVLLEGVGAARQELAPWLDATVWIHTEPADGPARDHPRHRHRHQRRRRPNHRVPTRPASRRTRLPPPRPALATRHHHRRRPRRPTLGLGRNHDRRRPRRHHRLKKGRDFRPYPASGYRLDPGHGHTAACETGQLRGDSVQGARVSALPALLLELG